MVRAGQEWCNDLIRFRGEGALFGGEIKFEFLDISIGRFGVLVPGCGGVRVVFGFGYDWLLGVGFQWRSLQLQLQLQIS
jgi:hypothetical protein